MQNVYEIAKVILPVIITGLFTFFITKYTYNKNIPLDKLEITYNRIYYPLYMIIENRNLEYNLCLNLVIKETSWRIKKYHKYFDHATLKTFNLMINSNIDTKKQLYFSDFRKNIYQMNSYLRRRLGYLEPNILQRYKYSSHLERFLFRFLIESSITFTSIILYTSFTNVIQTVLLYISACGLSVMIVDIMCSICMALYFKISGYIQYKKEKSKTIL